MTNRRVIIIGGGVAGISCAVHALENGWQPLLLEAAPQAGGRVRSSYVKDVQTILDNGQHVLSAAYRESRQLLETLGATESVAFQQCLEIHFCLNSQRSFTLRTWPLPAPFHFLLPLLKNAPLSDPDRRFLRRFAWVYLRSSEAVLQRMTVREWLNLAGSAPLLEKMLWEPLTLATLNTPIETASASLLYRVLKLAFLGNSRYCGLGIPLKPLGELFAAPVQAYLSKNNASFCDQTIVKKLLLENGRVSGVETHRGEVLSADAVISALPPHALQRVLAATGEAVKELQLPLDKFEYAPIITINLWLKKPLPARFPLALVDSPVQWIFPLTVSSQLPGLSGYALVISAATDFAGMPDAEMLQMIDSECRHYFLNSLWDDLGLEKFKIIREKRATILQTPQSLHYRLLPKTAIPNFFLAGDWIDTGLPATIESAAISGRMAVAAMVKWQSL